MTALEKLYRLPNPDRRFGRNVEHDVRSRAYRAAEQLQEPRKVEHEIVLPILDQQEGSCVLQTVTELVAFSDHWRTLTLAQQRLILLDPQLFIRDWYRWTTRNDPFAGEWEPTDTGTSGLSGAKCAVHYDYAKGYVHGFGLDETLSMLNDKPVGIGGVWMSSFDDPDSEGIIRWPTTARERGGHEWCAIGQDPVRGLVWARQTWGLGFGLSGLFAVPYEVLDKILHQDGDSIQLVPNDQPEPTPNVDPEDLVLAKNALPWARSRGFSRLTKAGRASQAIKDWAAIKGL